MRAPGTGQEGQTIHRRGGRTADGGRRAHADQAAFEAAFRQHFPLIYRFIARRVGTALAEDLAAETFATAYPRRASFEPGQGSLRSWLQP